MGICKQLEISVKGTSLIGNSLSAKTMPVFRRLAVFIGFSSIATGFPAETLSRMYTSLLDILTSRQGNPEAIEGLEWLPLNDWDDLTVYNCIMVDISLQGDPGPLVFDSVFKMAVRSSF